MLKAPRQKKTDTVSSNGSVESAKDETSITDGATIMAVIKSLETGIYQKFDAVEIYQKSGRCWKRIMVGALSLSLSLSLSRYSA